MNVHDPEIETEIRSDGTQVPTEQEAREALALLRCWASKNDANAFENLTFIDAAGGSVTWSPTDCVALSNQYPIDLVADKAYVAGLPDLQNGPASLICGAKTAIQHVGISNFRLPLRYLTRSKDEMLLETSVTGSVSLEENKKGINMSRIMRSFYTHAESVFSFDVMDAALGDFVTDLESLNARIQMRFSFPMKKQSLRSALEGYQYYNIALESTYRDSVKTRILHLDYLYSSTCPCSLELSEHARRTRGQLATPHSQRSVARVSVEVLPGETLWFEDLVSLCNDAVPTETQVMVKREDEQAFAELNAANPIFVEDAVRLFYQSLASDARIGNFRIVASHQESLHSHDAISVLCRGQIFEQSSFDPMLFDTLIHRG
jgi:GTP cyclohydrolase I